jgi:uncharacterized membrane protein YvbJ
MVKLTTYISEKRVKLTMNMKKKKLTQFILFGIMTLFFAVYLFSLEEKDRAIASFETALLNKDVSALKAMLVSSELKMTGANVKLLIDYLYENELVNQTIKEMKAGQSSDLLIVQEREKWYLFKEYDFKVKPYYINFKVDPSVRRITITNGQSIKVKSEQEQELKIALIPGDYDFLVSFETPYVAFNKNYRIEVSPSTARKNRTLHTSFYGVTLYINLQYWKDVELLINGESYGRVNESRVRLSPFLYDGSTTVAVRKKFPWGTFTSNEVKVKEREINLAIYPLNDIVRQEVDQVAALFMPSMQKAFQARDAQLLKNVTEKMKQQFSDHIKANKFNEYPDEMASYKLMRMYGMNTNSKDSSIHASVIVDEYYVWEEVSYSVGKEYLFIYDEEKQLWLADGWKYLYNHRNRAIYEQTGSPVN